MTLHNVYFWVKPEATKEDLTKFEQGIRDFLAEVDEIAHFEVGIPAKTPKREVTNHDFAYSIFVHFDSVKDHDIYQEHPAHKIFIDSFSHLWSKVSVFDSELV